MKSKTVYFNYADFELKKISLTFPGTEESTSHAKTPSIKNRAKTNVPTA